MKYLILLLLLLSSSVEAAKYQKWIDKYSNQYDIDSNIIEAIIQVESSQQHWVVGDDGLSHGLMQVQLSTARDMGFKGTEEELRYPYLNIKYGTKYIRYLINKFDLNINEALDAYNRGIRNIIRWPYRGDWENHRYVGKIIYYIKLKGVFYGQSNYSNERWFNQNLRTSYQLSKDKRKGSKITIF